MRPCGGDTGGHIGAAPTNLHHIFPRNPTQTKYHLHTIHPNGINRPTRNPPNEINRPRAICPNTILHSYAIHPNETVGAAPACPPERPRSGVSIPKIGLCTTYYAWKSNDGCAPAGRHGRAHRHRPYPSPSYFSTQSHTNKITIYTQSTQTTSTAPTNPH